MSDTPLTPRTNALALKFSGTANDDLSEGYGQAIDLCRALEEELYNANCYAERLRDVKPSDVARDTKPAFDAGVKWGREMYQLEARDSIIEECAKVAIAHTGPEERPDWSQMTAEFDRHQIPFKLAYAYERGLGDQSENIYYRIQALKSKPVNSAREDKP